MDATEAGRPGHGDRAHYRCWVSCGRQLATRIDDRCCRRAHERYVNRRRIGSQRRGKPTRERVEQLEQLGGSIDSDSRYRHSISDRFPERRDRSDECSLTFGRQLVLVCWQVRTPMEWAFTLRHDQ